MNSLDRAIREMKNEDNRYGEKTKGKKVLVNSKTHKNPKNLARYNVEELLAMEDEDYSDL